MAKLEWTYGIVRKGTETVMLNRYYIIDNFYDSPDGIAKLVLDNPETKLFSEDHCNFFSQIVSERLEEALDNCGRFTINKLDNTGIHFDTGNISWTGYVFLQKDHPKDLAGVEFWKHKETLIEEIPKTIEELKDLGYENLESFKTFIDDNILDFSKWESVFKIPYKYNRLVIFRPWLFRSTGSLISNNIIQTFYLKQKII